MRAFLLTIGLVCFLQASQAQERAGIVQGLTLQNAIFKDLALNKPLKETEVYKIVENQRTYGTGEWSVLEPGCWMCDEMWYCERTKIGAGVEFYQYTGGSLPECGLPLEESIYLDFHGNKVVQLSVTSLAKTIYQISTFIESRTDIKIVELFTYWFGEGEEIVDPTSVRKIRWQSEEVEVLVEHFPFDGDLGPHYRLDFVFTPTRKKLDDARAEAEAKLKAAEWKAKGF